MSILEQIYSTLFIAADRNIATTLSAGKKKNRPTYTSRQRVSNC